MLMKIRMNKIKHLLLAGLLFVMSFQPISVYAASSVDVNIPVSTFFTEGKPKPGPEISVVTEFRLEAVDGAPLPEKTVLRINGEGKDWFGNITYTVPGDYYYVLVSDLIEGDNCELLIEDDTTIRVSITNGEDGLVAVVKAYPSMDHAASDQAKRDTMQEIQYKPTIDPGDDSSDTSSGSSSDKSDSGNKPSDSGSKPGGSNGSGSNSSSSNTPTKGHGPNTAAALSANLWIWIALCATIILIFTQRKLSRDKSNR